MVKITHINMPMSSNLPFNWGVRGTPEDEYETTFDSYLTPNSGKNENYRLKIILRIHLKPEMPSWVADALTRSLAWAQSRKILDPDRRHNVRHDSDNKRFATMSWKPDEWTVFVTRFTQQASAWNRQFWLIPPPAFSDFDFEYRGNKMRPNIECEFEPSIVTAGDDPHTTVEAINLYVFNALFRSHSKMMSSAAVREEQKWALDPVGIARNVGNRTAVAHEVGHMLGLPHIGESRKLPHCQLAIMLDETFPEVLIPAMWKDGYSAEGCYGHWAPPGAAENVMGMGTKFAVENAAPWLERLPHHVKSPINIENWKVSISNVAPAKVSTGSSGAGKKMHGAAKIGE